MSKRVLCKFFAHGACLKGDHCEFSHDWKAAPNNVCTFYQKGACSYGNRCRYDHVKVSRSHSSTGSSSANSLQFAVSDSATVTHPSGSESSGLMAVSSVNSELSATSRPFFPPGNLAWNQNSGLQSLVDHDDIGEPNSLDPADRAICSFAAAGICPRGEKCPHVHGDLCPCCGKHCLHPFRPQEREEHIKLCQKKQKHLDALKHSQEIECSVCLERVLSKPTAAERKFGLLSECDHPFCISCIRNWRSSSPSSGMDVNSTLRACPICRKVSFFVIPSVIWYSTKEDKQEIVDSYKTKLRSIDCKHFDFGNGTCPFGTSCFYKHTVKPGSHIWNYNLMRDCYSSHSSYDEDIDGIHLLFKYLYKSQSAIGVQDLEDYGDEDLDEDYDFEDYNYYDFDDYTDPFHEDYQNYDFDDFTNPYQDFENEMFQELLNCSDEDLENDVPMTEEMVRFLSMMALGGLSDSSGDED